MQRISYAFTILLLAASALADSEAPTVSPDGRRIAFISNRDGRTDLYVIGADGTGEVRLTDNDDREGRPDWSRDGRHIWFSVSTSEGSRIYSIDPDGSKLHQIGAVPGRSVRLSPDGRRTLYAMGSWTVMNLMVSNLDGSKTRMLNDGTSIAWGPQWSPRGKQIAYGSQGPEKKLDVWVMNSDGSRAHQLTHIAGAAQMPAWSRDERRLAVQVDNAAAKTARIWIADAKTGDAHPIPVADGAYADEVPYWFPDGKRIAFQSNRTGRHEIWTINIDGSDPRQITK
jgi:TolB protein